MIYNLIRYNSLLSYSFIFYLTISLVCAFDCRNLDCKNVQCEPLTCSPGFYLEPNLSEPCSCCSGCVKYQGEDSDCQVTSNKLPIDSCLRTFESKECEKNLTCYYWDPVNLVTLDVGKCSLFIPEKEYQSKPCIKRISSYLEKDRNSNWFWPGDCDDQGQFQPKQCKRNRCFCSAANGDRIFGNFHAQAYEKTNCMCSLMEMKLNKIAEDRGDFSHVSCERNGNYKPLQCINDMCFCVNETNGEVIGKIVPKIVVDRLPCYTNERSFKSQFETACQRERSIQEKTATYYYNKGMKYEFLPITRCDPDGSYVAKQCDHAQCFCVDPGTGKGIPGYVVSSRSVEANDMNCYCLRDFLEMSSDGGSVQAFDCNKNGNYRSLACHGNICYCRDRDGAQDSGEYNVAQWFEDPCIISDPRLKECYLKNDNVDCSHKNDMTTIETIIDNLVQADIPPMSLSTEQ